MTAIASARRGGTVLLALLVAGCASARPDVDVDVVAGEEIVTAELIQHVYDLPCRVIPAPVSGRPLVLPLDRDLEDPAA